MTTQHRQHASGSREVAIVFLGRLSVYVFGLLRQSLLAYLLLPEGRGAYAVCVTFASLLGTLVAVSADRGAQYYVMAGRISVSCGLSLALGVCLSGSVIAVAASLPLIHGNFAFFQNADAGSLQLALALIPLISFSMAAELQLAGLRRFTPLAGLLSLQMLVTVFLTVTLVGGLEMEASGAILALAAGHVVFFVGSILDLRKHHNVSFEMPSPSEFRQVLGFGLRFHAIRVGNEGVSHFGVVALGLLASRAEIGVFAAASAIMFRLNVFTDSIATVLYPRVPGGIAQHMEMFSLCLRIACLLTGTAMAAFLAISTPLVRILLSEAFLPAVPVMWILAPGIIAHAAASLFVTYFNGVERPGISAWGVWTGLSASSVVVLVLYPELDMRAAAWSLTAGLTVRTVFLAFIFHRKTRMTLASVWRPRFDDLVFTLEASRTVIRRTGNISSGGKTSR